MAVPATPWGHNPSPDVTTNGFVTPEYQKMAGGTEGLEGEEEDDSSSSNLLSQALATIQQQSSVIQSLLKQMASK